MSSSVHPVSVVVLHAYSPKNSGDGLLVELTVKLIREAFVEPSVTIVALEAEAFPSTDVIQWRGPIPFGTSALGRRMGMLTTVAVGPHREITTAVTDADVVVAVGGGYLRGGSAGELVKTLGAHLGQLRLAGLEGGRSVYLSQSIGPFHRLARPLILRHLQKFATVALRDDRSVAEFASAPGVVRLPDLAVMELAARGGVDRPQHAGGKPIIVARNLSRPRNFYRLLEEASASQGFDWALQSTGGGNDDFGITQRLSGESPRKLADVLSSSAPRVVISTRLHGSMAALLAGFPTIHLSYERKGWGAFDDLGIPDYVVNARDATLDDVNRLVQRIERDPSAYWARVDASLPEILSSRQNILESIRAAHRRPGVANTPEDAAAGR